MFTLAQSWPGSIACHSGMKTHHSIHHLIFLSRCFPWESKRSSMRRIANHLEINYGTISATKGSPPGCYAASTTRAGWHMAGLEIRTPHDIPAVDGFKAFSSIPVVRPCRVLPRSCVVCSSSSIQRTRPRVGHQSLKPSSKNGYKYG